MHFDLEGLKNISFNVLFAVNHFDVFAAPSANIEL